MPKHLNFIHIPKTGGNYVHSILPGLGQKRHMPMTENDIQLYVNFVNVRNPYTFYTSMYYFFKNDPHVSNNMKYIARSNNINNFVKIIIDKQKLKGYFQNLNMVGVSYDHANNPNNEYGILTSYYRYMCNPLNYEKNEDIFKFMDEKMNVMRLENIDNDLHKLIRKYKLRYNNNFNRKANVSKKEEDKLSLEIKELIYNRERDYFEHFKYDKDT
jgi:hypothetical protein